MTYLLLMYVNRLSLMSPYSLTAVCENVLVNDVQNNTIRGSKYPGDTGSYTPNNECDPGHLRIPDLTKM